MSQTQFAVCIDNRGYEVSLERRKVYELVPDESARLRGYLRVIDESGKDYLFPKERFVLVQLQSPSQASALRSS